MVVFGACSAQSANAQNTNIAQRIIGTWVSNDGKMTWVFNANGTAKLSDLYGDNRTAKFVVIDTMLACEAGDGFAAVYNIIISSDGKTLILGGGLMGAGYWFTKK